MPLIIKPLLLGLPLSAVITVLYGLLTAHSSGFHMITGEQMQLSGAHAIYAMISEYGITAYLLQLLPCFTISLTLIYAGCWFFINNAGAH